MESEHELFYNADTDKEAVIITDQGECRLGYHAKEGLTAKIVFPGGMSFENVRIDEKLTVRGLRDFSSQNLPVKRYNFKVDVRFKRGHSRYLVPPYGPNLLSILLNYPDLREEVKGLFMEYGLQLVLDKATQTIRVSPTDTQNDILYLVPYNSIADTLQRIIFHKAAVASNSNSILLFEEPEAHSFPPYMVHFTQEMIHKKDNQYFMATHSPFILNDLLENCREELAVFVVSYADYETRVRQLTREELDGVYQDGIDLFTNSESFE